jgi:DNA processing protein
LAQGPNVLAVPGHPFDARAAGGNMLIHDGATLIRNAPTLTKGLPPLPPQQPALPLQEPKPAKHNLQEASKLHMQILSCLEPSTIAKDHLIRDLTTPPAQVNPILLDLELDGQISRHAGGLLARII